jgi:hypothetical protein
MDLSVVVGTIVVVNLVAAVLVALFVFTSAQDFVQVLPKIIDSLSYALSSRQRFEVLLARRRHLEEQLVIEMINQSGNKGTTKTLTVSFVVHFTPESWM